MLSRAIAGTVAMMNHDSRNALPSTDSELPAGDPVLDDGVVADYMAGFFQYTSPEGTNQVLHIDSEQARPIIEELRSRMDQEGQFDDDPGSKDTWLPETLDPTDATMRLMRGARANVVLQHGGVGCTATTDLNNIVLQEMNARLVSSQNSTGTVDDAEVGLGESEPDKIPAYDPDKDPLFLTGHVNFKSQDYQVPAHQARTELLLPRPDIPTEEEWQSMTDASRRMYRSTYESVSKGRQDIERSWDTAASKIRPKPRSRSKRKKPVVESEDSGTDNVGNAGNGEGSKARSKRKKPVVESEDSGTDNVGNAGNGEGSKATPSKRQKVAHGAQVGDTRPSLIVKLRAARTGTQSDNKGMAKSGVRSSARVANKDKGKGRGG